MYNHRDAANKKPAVLYVSVCYRKEEHKRYGPKAQARELSLTSRRDSSSADVTTCFLIGSSSPDLQ